MEHQSLPVWIFWLVSAVLIIAAIIDGRSLRVPNWLTYAFALIGLVVSARPGGLTLIESLKGLALGLALLLPLYAVGGMGAGDVKLLGGLGAWIGPTLVWNAFVVSVAVGAVIALVMMVASGRARAHFERMKFIALEWVTVRNPVVLSEIAAARKHNMCLLPYGIPIAVGSIGFFAAARLLG